MVFVTGYSRTPASSQNREVHSSSSASPYCGRVSPRFTTFPALRQGLTYATFWPMKPSKADREIHVIAHDIRSRENIGMLFRSLEFLGASKLWITGYSPSPRTNPSDSRGTADPKIEKIALGAENTLDWEAVPRVEDVIEKLRKDGFRIAALELTKDAIPIRAYNPSGSVALLLGREVEGVSPTLLELCDDVVQIPRRGTKESLNVAFAAAIAVWEILPSYPPNVPQS